MYYQYQNDERAVSIEDQFIWGDAFMIAPVLVKGQKSRDVYLPEGNWYDYHSHQFFAGKQTISFNTDDYKYPVLIKAGSFIPQFLNRVKNTLEQKSETLTVLYIPSEKSSSYQLYFDDGISKNAISSKQYELINFSSKGKTASTLEIMINSNGGNYSGKMAQRKINFQIPGIEQMPKKITINKQSLSILDASETRGISAGEQAIWNLGKQHQLLLPVGFSSKPIQILINW